MFEISPRFLDFSDIYTLKPYTFVQTFAVFRATQKCHPPYRKADKATRRKGQTRFQREYKAIFS